MTTILGIVGSARVWGNGELLIRQVLRAAQAEGAGSQMIRLTDLHLEMCTGCLRCALGRRPCPLDDDLSWLLDTLAAASGLVLAAPTYFLAPPAAVKLVLDRLLMLAGRPDTALLPPRPGVTIATAGLSDWRGVTLPYLNALAAALGYHPIDSLLAVAPGPGEVLLDQPLLDRAFDAGRRLARGEMDASPVPPNVCPTCRCDAFVLDGAGATCPICGRRAAVQQTENGIRLQFDPADAAFHRWTPEALQHHIVDWVVATGPRFLALLHEIKARRALFREMDVQ